MDQSAQSKEMTDQQTRGGKIEDAPNLSSQMNWQDGIEQ